MKKITIVLMMFVSICFCAKATVLTVSNSPISGGQYTDIQTAINAASLDDTIYVNGSPVTYAACSINKRITLIGAGYYVTGTQYNMSTVVNGISLDSAQFQTNPVGGAHIIGIQSTITNNITTTNIHIERCAGSINYPSGEGWVIENCLINQLYFVAPVNVASRIIRNNIIYGYIGANQQINGAGIIIDHNIIEGVINSISFAVISNNVFFFANVSGSSGNTFNSYNKNITVSTTGDIIPFGSNSGSGNFTNVSPGALFVGGVSTPQTFPGLTSVNWNLLTTCVGHNAASDGTDIGIYGGASPMPNLTGASTLPQMTLMNINNASIPLNGTLNYEFKARKSN